MQPAGRIKVLHIIKSLGRGGAEMLLPETLKMHDQQQFEFHYMYFLPWKNQMVEALEQAGGKVTCVAASNNLQLLLRWRRVARYIREHDIRVVHCHLPWAGVLGRWLFRTLRIPVLYTEHNKQERYHWITRWINRFTFNWQTLALAVSDDVAESIKKNIRPRIEVKVVRNGVSTSHFRRNQQAGEVIRRELGIPPGAVVVGTVAVFRFQKRLKAWLDVFHAAASADPNLFGILVGDGPLREEIALHQKQLELEKRVIMPGLKADIVPWLSAMDIFMMTSVFEGLPVALLEAMSAGCAVLTTDAGGIKEVIRPDTDGIIVPVGNYLDLVPHLKDLAAVEEKRQRFAAAARSRAEKEFDLHVMSRELESLYLSLA